MKKMILVLMALVVSHGALAQTREAPGLNQIPMLSNQRPAASTTGKGATRALAIEPTYLDTCLLKPARAIESRLAPIHWE